MKGCKLAFWINISRKIFYFYLLLYSKENNSFNIIHNFVISSRWFPFNSCFSLSVFFCFFCFVLFCFFFSYLCVHHLFSSLLFCLFSQACLNILTVLPSFYIHVRFIFQNVYGIFGRKSNKKLIERYEHFALGNCNALKLSRMLKVTVSRYSTTLHFNFSRASLNHNQIFHLQA